VPIAEKNSIGCVEIVLRLSGKVVLQIWDVGGQPRFRSMWERYCRGVTAIV